MKTNSDPLYQRLKDMDFSDARPVSETPLLARLQAEASGAGKTRINIRVDKRTLAAFKARAEATGGNYQTLMNGALAQFAQGQTLADVVRETILETLAGEALHE